MDWSTLPDLVCVTLLIFAFASVSRNSLTHKSKIWLAGWVLIAVHFYASMYLQARGMAANVADWIALSSLCAAGVLFLWSAVPYRKRASSRWMVGVLLGGSTFYVGLITLGTAPLWVRDGSVLLLGLMPLAVAVATMRRFQSWARWMLVALYGALAVFGLVVQGRADGPYLTLNGLLAVSYLVCCVVFWLAYRMKTTGSFITITGFLAWSLVFVVSPVMQQYFPRVHVESEVWNLPKYVVAVGMILLLLEEQIAHNRHLALHDELTGLPNRRLFQNRLENALRRAARKRQEVGLLLIDLDDFKLVNDVEGHHVGDELLKQVSSLFLTRIRASDTVARTGGDEFSLILEGPVTRRQAEEVARALKELLAGHFVVEGRQVQVGASVGLAMYPADAKDAETLRVASDVAMYADKVEGKERGGEEPAGVFAPDLVHPLKDRPFCR